MLTTRNITLACLRNWIPKSELCVLNAYTWCPNFEADFTRITRASIMHEVEVKVSRKDFLADFEKGGRKLVHIPDEGYRYRELNKHRIMETGNSGLGTFSFITPPGLLTEDDIPRYAGWYEARITRGRLRVLQMKKPPRLPSPIKHPATKLHALRRNIVYHHQWKLVKELQRLEKEHA